MKLCLFIVVFAMAFFSFSNLIYFFLKYVFSLNI
nr:MAG TPA: hypothetical protein [Caudoviricetes sp.]